MIRAPESGGIRSRSKFAFRYSRPESDHGEHRDATGGAATCDSHRECGPARPSSLNCAIWNAISAGVSPRASRIDRCWSLWRRGRNSRWRVTMARAGGKRRASRVRRERTSPRGSPPRPGPSISASAASSWATTRRSVPVLDGRAIRRESRPSSRPIGVACMSSASRRSETGSARSGDLPPGRCPGPCRAHVPGVPAADEPWGLPRSRECAQGYGPERAADRRRRSAARGEPRARRAQSGLRACGTCHEI